MASSTGNRWTDINLNVSDVKLAKSYNEISTKNIYIFFSFDLVGSTKFKTEEKEIWPDVIFRFYELIYKDLKNKIPEVVVWKYLGDEVLLYVSIRDLEIYKIPDIAFSVQSEVSKEIQELFRTKKLDIKSTIWIAAVRTVESKEFNLSNAPKTNRIYKNMKVKLSVGEALQWDFLGPDMDIGFRVSKFAYHNKVVLSADFAYLLHRTKPDGCKIDDKLRIVSFETLKGVWENRYYPIVWYYPNWENKHLEKSFFYADHKENAIVEQILLERIYPISSLQKVYKELGKWVNITAFVKEFSKMNFSKKRSFLLPLETKK